LVGVSFLLIFVGWAIRLIVTFFISYSKGLTRKERLFVVATWSPKATVQAALASVFLNEATKYDLGPEYVKYGIMIQTTAILSICITAPIGAILMQTLGPKLLPVETEEDNKIVDAGATEEDLKAETKAKEISEAASNISVPEEHFDLEMSRNHTRNKNVEEVGP
jgi:hypothetical protein